MKRHLTYIGALAILVIIFGTIYAVVQQAQRTAANDPQIQLAEDTAAILNRGVSPSNLATAHVDMAASLAPFVLFYNNDGQVVAGSGYLNGSLATPPIGVLTAAKGHNYHIVTWQPARGVRIAAVTIAAKNYYVLSGRSLKQVELNENATLLMSLIGGVAAAIVLSGVYYLTEKPREV
jgi:hypothetical protein